MPSENGPTRRDATSASPTKPRTSSTRRFGDPVALRERPEVVDGASAGMQRLRVEQGTDLMGGKAVSTVGAAVDGHVPAGRRVETEDEAHRRALARAVRAEEPGHLARPRRRTTVRRPRASRRSAWSGHALRSWWALLDRHLANPEPESRRYVNHEVSATGRVQRALSREPVWRRRLEAWAVVVPGCCEIGLSLSGLAGEFGEARCMRQGVDGPTRGSPRPDPCGAGSRGARVRRSHDGRGARGCRSSRASWASRPFRAFGAGTRSLAAQGRLPDGGNRPWSWARPSRVGSGFGFGSALLRRWCRRHRGDDRPAQGVPDLLGLAVGHVVSGCRRLRPPDG